MTRMFARTAARAPGAEAHAAVPMTSARGVPSPSGTRGSARSAAWIRAPVTKARSTPLGAGLLGPHRPEDVPLVWIRAHEAFERADDRLRRTLQVLGRPLGALDE